MSEPYYRISTAQSELDDMLYEQGSLSHRLASEAAEAGARGGEPVPRIARIKATHNWPFHQQYRPTVIMANQILCHSNSSNNRFTLEYGGEFLARMYQAVDISAGALNNPTVTPAGSTLTANTGWAYCPNFVAALLTQATFKVSTDPLYEFSGEMLYVFYSAISPVAQHTALARMLRETTYEMRWVPGGAANGEAYGLAGAASVFDNVMMIHPDTPAQAYALTHPAMTVYIPYSLFTMNNVENAYPEVAVYSLTRSLEYSFKDLINVINLWAVSSTAAGFVNPTFSGTEGYTWALVPAITGTRIYVEHITLHRDMQQMMAMNPHAFMIRQYFRSEETMDSKASHEIAITKVIESLYLVSTFNRNSFARTPIDDGTTTVDLTATATTPVIHPIDPFYMPVGTKPINGISISARGQQFYRDVKWDEFGTVWPFFFGKPDNNTTASACLAVITFGLWYFQQAHTGTYNSGWGPNLRITWTSQAFSAANPGTLKVLLQCINMVLAYRGALTVRYT